MNSSSGRIKDFETKQAARDAGFEIQVKNRPNATCSKCKGTGAIKRLRGTKFKFRPCKCTL